MIVARFGLFTGILIRILNTEHQRGHQTEKFLKNVLWIAINVVAGIIILNIFIFLLLIPFIEGTSSLIKYFPKALRFQAVALHNRVYSAWTKTGFVRFRPDKLSSFKWLIFSNIPLNHAIGVAKVRQSTLAERIIAESYNPWDCFVRQRALAYSQWRTFRLSTSSSKLMNS